MLELVSTLLLFVGASGLLVWSMYLSFHQRSIALSGQNSFRGTCALAIVNKSSSDSFDSEHLFFILISLTWENTLSTTPLEAGRENKSSTKARTLSHSDAMGLEKGTTKQHDTQRNVLAGALSNSS